MPHFIALLLLLACSLGAAAQPRVARHRADRRDRRQGGGDRHRRRRAAHHPQLGQTWIGITVVSVERDERHHRGRRQARVLPLGQHHRSAAARIRPAQSVTLAADTARPFRRPTGRSTAARCASWSTPAPLWSRYPPPMPCGWASTTARASALRPRPRTAWCRSTWSPSSGSRSAPSSCTSVDGIVIEQGLDIALLGMSFLSRVDMKHDGQTLDAKRF